MTNSVMISSARFREGSELLIWSVAPTFSTPKDDALTHVHSPNASWPERVAICLIATPTALFFATWFQPLLGLPAAAMVAWTAWRLARSVSPAPLPSPRAMALLGGISLFWSWIAGLGGFFQQMWDYNFRNALLHDLISHSWPVLWDTPRGLVALDYYLAWSLIPSLVGKALGWRAATLAMAVICAAGAFLLLLVFVRVVGTWRWWIPFVFLMWSGMDIVGWGLRRQFDINMLFIENWCYPPLWFTSHMINFFCTPHLAIPTWLIAFMVAGRRIGPGGVIGLSALLFPLAPYQTVGLVPFALWGAWQGDGGFRDRIRGVLTVENILMPLVALAMCAPFFLGNVGAGKDSGWFFDSSPSSISPWVILFAFLLVEVLVWGAAIWLCGQRDRLLLLAVAVLCLIPLRQSGATNDLALKVPMAGLAIMALFTAKAFVSKQRPWARWLLICVFTVGAVTPLHEIWTATRFTLYGSYPLEADAFKTFDPKIPPKPSFEKTIANFRSRPLDELPLLRWMLAGRPPS